MRFIDELFRMEGGYVLDFSNKTFAEFFSDELNVNIDDKSYFEEGASKGKRMRFFLKKADQATVLKTINALWEYRLLFDARVSRAETIKDVDRKFSDLLLRLGEPSNAREKAAPTAKYDASKIDVLKTGLLTLSGYAPHARGYAFEEWLIELFIVFRLEARNPFKNRGEQIDGSFMLNGEIYLLEAKWQNALVSIQDLHAFHGKVIEKAAWTRGLFVSNTGFSADGLHAFGRGKSLICMDGLDLSDMLSAGLPFDLVLEAKVRRASETGLVFARVRELFHF